MVWINLRRSKNLVSWPTVRENLVILRSKKHAHTSPYPNQILMTLEFNETKMFTNDNCICMYSHYICLTLWSYIAKRMRRQQRPIAGWFCFLIHQLPCEGSELQVIKINHNIYFFIWIINRWLMKEPLVSKLTIPHASPLYHTGNTLLKSYPLDIFFWGAILSILNPIHVFSITDNFSKFHVNLSTNEGAI
jgi:hypothetical protein